MGTADGGPHRGGCELFASGQSESDGKVGGLKNIDRDIDPIPQMCDVIVVERVYSFLKRYTFVLVGILCVKALL